MSRLRLGLFLALVVILCTTPALPMLPVADDFPRGILARSDDCAEILEKIDAERPLIMQIPDSDELQQLLRDKPISDIRRCLRKRRGTTSPPQVNEPPRRPEIRVSDIDRLYLLPGFHCDRPLPTKQEFLRMLKDRPSDAHQILRRCNVPIGNISPLRQLPVGGRQLPVDTRQRPVGTW